MVQALEEVKSIPKFFLNTFFPYNEKIITPYVDIDIEKGKRRIATMCSKDGDGIMVEKNGFETHSTSFPYFYLRDTVKPKDLIERRQLGETMYQGNQLNDSAQKVLGKMIVKFIDMVAGAEEKMAIDAITTGKITITGDGVSQEVDFNMPATHLLGVSDLSKAWSDASADIMADLGTFANLVFKDSGLNADIAILGSDVSDAIMKNTGIQTILDKLRYNPGNIEISDPADGVQYIGTLKGKNFSLKLYNYCGYYHNGSADTLLLDSKKIILGSTRARTTRYYGPIYRFDNGEAQLGMSTKDGHYSPNSWMTPDKKVIHVALESSPLPAIHQSSAYVTVQVIS